jgi:lycopene cyclase domain-containing protein
MDAHYTYLLLDLFTLLGPLALSFDRRVAFYKQWRALLPWMLITGAVFIAWDVAFTDMGVWSFAEGYTIGLKWLGLPVEEWLFFFTVPYACAFVVACARAYGRWSGNDWGWRVFPALGLVLELVGIVYLDRWYTATTFLGAGAALQVVWAVRKRLSHFRADAFLIGYALCLIPFSIVNGILTALPVVIYNDAENLGIRLYTIPFEDAFYGMLLILGSAIGLRGRLGSAYGVTETSAPTT